MTATLAFSAPLVLLALASLPIIWWLLRATPPAARKEAFPGVQLLLGLKSSDPELQRTPWWVLLLRSLALAAFILACAGPLLVPENTQERATSQQTVVIAIDPSWRHAHQWALQRRNLETLLAQLGQENRLVQLVLIGEKQGQSGFDRAETWSAQLASLTPNAFTATQEDMEAFFTALPETAEFIWISDGFETALPLAQWPRLPDLVIEPSSNLTLIRSVTVEDGTVVLSALRAGDTTAPRSERVSAIGAGPQGGRVILGQFSVDFAANETTAEGRLNLPPEVRNRIASYRIEGHTQAGAVFLSDDSLKRREVGLVASEASSEVQDLLNPLFYLDRALQGRAEVETGPVDRLLESSPDVLIFSDLARLPPKQEQAVVDWVERGGLVLRFAGPQLAAQETDLSDIDPLLPVRLRHGGRDLGGSLSWGDTKTIRAFEAEGPFAGLQIPQDLQIFRQVMAAPDPDLRERTLAALEDGTPLITRKRIGEGQVILFHVTANAEWSNLPLSGLFLSMLERITGLATTNSDATELANRLWQPIQVLNGFGGIETPSSAEPIEGLTLTQAPFSAHMRPGVYINANQTFALNIGDKAPSLAQTQWPSTVPLQDEEQDQLLSLAPYLFLATLVALLLDTALFSFNRLGTKTTATLCTLPLMLLSPHSAEADTESLIRAANDVTLAYVVTGDPSVDRLSEAGLRGLSLVLTQRTSIEPVAPVGLDLERDTLTVYPLIYWPMTETQELPSVEAYARLNRYLRSGGMILFDTRDGDIRAFGQTPAAQQLQRLTRELDLPPIDLISEGHILRRTFYLLQDFPGRYTDQEIWVAASVTDTRLERAPLVEVNDGVTPVVIGANDWASAWAIDEDGRLLVPLGSGFNGERQREIAFRFGINIVMHVLSGNYKSDQVHVPALLDRLGQ